MTPAGADTGRRSGLPYVGLRPFRDDEYGIFFGREREARDISTVWQATGLTILFGASGVGKTSLLHAGVLPRIEAARADVMPVARLSPQPPAASPTGANRYVSALLAGWAPPDGPSPPAGMTVSEFLAARPMRLDRYGDPVPVLAAIDQTEELFSGPPQWNAERKACLEQLARAVAEHDGLHLLLSLREEHLAAVLPYERPLGHGSRARFHLRPFTREAALDAVIRPLAGTHRSYGPQAAETLVDDLRTVTFISDEGLRTRLVVDAVEPVQLQVVCSALWQSLPAEVGEITVEHVRAHADVDRFLLGFCKRVLGEVASEHGVAEGEIRHWLRSRLVTDHGTRNVVYEGLRETAGMPNAVARALEDRHVLKAEHRMGIRWYELQHDRLITAVRQPEPPRTGLAQAREALAQGRWEAARGLAEEAVRVAEIEDAWVRAEAQAILGEVDVANGRVGDARRRFTEAAELFTVLQRFDKVAQVLTAQGRLWLAQGEDHKAVDTLKAAVSRASGDLSAQVALGDALWRLGQLQAALSCLNGAVDRADRPQVEALALRGEILTDLGRARDALRDLMRVRSERRPETMAARALAFAMSGRRELAEQEAWEALETLEATSGRSTAGSGMVPGEGTGSGIPTTIAGGAALIRIARARALLGQRESAAELAARALDLAGSAGLPAHLLRQANDLISITA